MHKRIADLAKGKKILILGFGKEGISSYKLLIRTIPGNLIAIADQNEILEAKLDFKIDSNCIVYAGKNYLDAINNYDVIIKTPGISVASLSALTDFSKITSQTELFLRVFSNQTIGITGTKGKSTTSSLIKHILSAFYDNVLLVGNIGIPPFDLIDKIGADTRIVFELSSHQLEHISVAPHIGVILNFFEEHLDHYKDYLSYQLAKFNIVKYQQDNDWFVMNSDDRAMVELFKLSNLKRKLITFSREKGRIGGAFIEKESEIVFELEDAVSKFNFTGRKYLPGIHNLMNIMAAICVSKILNVPDEIIETAINGFKGLKHRMEYLGDFKGISFYNDSISTIPQATIQAVVSLKRVDTLILGGKDRGIDYTPLIEFLPTSGVRNIIFTGEAGKRIIDGLKSVGQHPEQKWFFITSYTEIPEIIRLHTRVGSICLLSPAAASYDSFKNFEERGEVFKKIAENL
jgi:UDP-N-acetylmuramoyl-L-alanine---L-glutamate ligase